VTGLGADEKLEIGGDDAVILTHEGNHYQAFSAAGYATVEKPWPKKGTVGFRVTLPGGERRFAWMISDGRFSSQSNGPARADVVVKDWKPLDDAAWTTIEHIVRIKLPEVVVQMKEHRAHDAHKHMRNGVPNGWAEVYDACRGIDRIASFVEEQAKDWKALMAKPVEFEPYTVVKRSEQRAWRTCATNAECTIARGACGFPDAIAKSAKGAYASWAKTREDQINCDQPEDGDKITAACVAATCVDPHATKQAQWAACKVDDDCVVDLECEPSAALAVNKKTRTDPGYLRWRWWQVVDAWDRCSDPDVPSKRQAKCISGSCR
jgi:hypothetical protein